MIIYSVSVSSRIIKNPHCVGAIEYDSHDYRVERSIATVLFVATVLTPSSRTLQSFDSVIEPVLFNRGVSNITP
jgi:hypothetical protein